MQNCIIYCFKNYAICFLFIQKIWEEDEKALEAKKMNGEEKGEVNPAAEKSIDQIPVAEKSIDHAEKVWPNELLNRETHL